MTVEEILTFKNDSFNKPRYIKPNNITDYKTDEFADQLSRSMISAINNEFIKWNNN